MTNQPLAPDTPPVGPRVGETTDFELIHHTQCGAGALADDTFRHAYAQRIGADEVFLRQRAVLDPAQTVTKDVARLRSAPAISPRVTVSGHVYDVTTGLVTTLLPPLARHSTAR